MIKIRNGVFETNSSSMHSICITKSSKDLDLPDKIVFKHGEFSWEFAKLDEPEEKASYLYEAICELYDKKEKEKIINDIYDILGRHGIDSEFEPEKKTLYGTIGYIDHPYDLKDFVRSVIVNERRLLRFLFSKESFILTGNDNTDREMPKICVKYKHEEYQKGN